jgi:hypothetical protein
MAEKTRRRPPLPLSPCAPSHLNKSHRYGRLSVGCCVLQSSRSHRNPRPHRPLYFYFCRRSIRRLKGRLNVLAHAFRPFASPLQRPPSRRHHRSVGCCVSLSNDGHLRPVLRPSLNFSMGAISAPQTKASNAARASPATGRLH